MSKCELVYEQAGVREADEAIRVTHYQVRRNLAG
jgi:hypothetical protein